MTCSPPAATDRLPRMTGHEERPAPVSVTAAVARGSGGSHTFDSECAGSAPRALDQGGTAVLPPCPSPLVAHEPECSGPGAPLPHHSTYAAAALELPALSGDQPAARSPVSPFSVSAPLRRIASCTAASLGRGARVLRDAVPHTDPRGPLVAKAHAFEFRRELPAVRRVLVDSGATCTIVRCPLDRITSRDKFVVRGISGEIVSHEVGDLALRVRAGDGAIHSLRLSGVVRCRDVNLDILSVSVLDSMGYKVYFGTRGGALRSPDGVVYPLQRHRSLYWLPVVQPLAVRERYVHVLSSTSPAQQLRLVLGDALVGAATLDLWHQRLGHLSADTIQKVSAKRLAEGMGRVLARSGAPHGICRCDTCEMSKAHRRAIATTRRRPPDAPPRRPFERVVADVCGPFDVSCQGDKYFIPFVCAETGFAYTALLRTKAGAVAALRDFLAWLRLRRLDMPAELLTDVGGEFHGTSRHHRAGAQSRRDTEFTSVLRAAGCRHLLTSAHASALAGIAERRHRALKEMANSFLYHAGLSHAFWGYALLHAAWVINRVPARRRDASPYQLVFRERPQLHQLRVWGSDAYAWQADLPKGRFRAKAQRMLYVGVPPDSEGLLLLDPVTMREHVCYHATVNESFDNRARLLRELDVEISECREDLARNGGGKDTVDITRKDSAALERLLRHSDLEAFRRLFHTEEKRWELMRMDLEDGRNPVSTYGPVRPGGSTPPHGNSPPGGSTSGGSSPLAADRSPERPEPQRSSGSPAATDPTVDTRRRSRRLARDATSPEPEETEHPSDPPAASLDDEGPAPEDEALPPPLERRKRPPRYKGRSLPGKPAIQPIAPEDLEWLEVAEKEELPILFRPNPKRKESRRKYDIYSRAKTIGEFYQICQRELLMSRGVARSWLHFDYERGYILFPGHENEESVNYCTPDLVNSALNVVRPRFADSEKFQDLLMNLAHRDDVGSDAFLADPAKAHALAFETIQRVMASDPTRLGRLANEPANWREALRGPDSDVWRESMQSEIDSLEKFGCWDWVPISDARTRLIGSRWVYKIKRGPDGEPLRAKSRLVALGNTQGPETYNDTFAPVVLYMALRVVFAIAVQEGLHLFQMDCSNAYIQGDIDCTIFMKGPPGFERVDARGRPLVLRLKRSIYGLRQAGNIWHRTLVGHLESLGYRSLISDSCLFLRSWEDNGVQRKVIICLYVDDLMCAATHPELKDELLVQLRARFDVKDETKPREGWVLNMKYELSPDGDRVKITQVAAITAIAKKFGLDNDKRSHVQAYNLPMQLGTKLTLNEGDKVPAEEFDYRSAIGSCLYIAQSTRPEISYAVMSLSRHLNNPGKQHVKAAQHLIRYLWRTRDLGLEYFRTASPVPGYFEGFSAQSTAPPRWRSPRFSDEDVELDPVLTENYTDADYGGSYDGRSTSGFCFFLCGGVVKWGSKLQNVTALSTTESEVYALTESTKELLYLRTMLAELGYGDLSRPAVMYEDNSACIAQGRDLRSRSKAKHYVLRLRFLQERVARGEIHLWHCPTKLMVADALTKQLELGQFQRLRDYMLGRATMVDAP